MHQERKVTGFAGKLSHQFQEDGHCKPRAPRGHQYNAKIELRLSTREFHEFLMVAAHVGHVSKVDELLQRVGCLKGILPHLWWMHARLARNIVPTGDGGDRWGNCKCLGHNTAIHIQPNRKPKRRQCGGGDIKKRGRADRCSGAEPGA